MSFFSFSKRRAVSFGAKERATLDEFKNRLMMSAYTSCTSDEYKKWKADVEAWISSIFGVASWQYMQFQTVTTWYEKHEIAAPKPVPNAYDRMITMGYDKATMQNMEDYAWDKLVESIGIQKEVDAEEKQAHEEFIAERQKHTALFRAEATRAFLDWVA